MVYFSFGRMSKRRNSQDLGGEKKSQKVTDSQLLTKDKPYICELSIFNRQAHDSIVKAVGEMIGRHLNNPNVEIEAKLGLLIDKDTKSRIQLPILTEAIITQERHIRFQSDMSQAQHQHFNQMLNSRVNETNIEGYKGKKITYKHLYEKDSFYSTKNGKVRVTSDSRTDKIKEGGIVSKSRIETLDIFSPLNNLDFRISVNDEIPVAEPSGDPIHTRIKDRLSYEHDLWRIDLTQVKTQANGSNGCENGLSMSHELEIEVSNLEVLKNEYQLKQEGKPNQYLHFIHCFLNNVRLLAQFSKKR